MKLFLAATLVAAYPVFCQDSDLCISAEERHSQFRADSSAYLVPGVPGRTSMPHPIATERRAQATEDCLLKRTSSSSAKPAGPVSYYQLRHKIPKKAKKEFTIGARLVLLGESNEAELHFRKAIALDPSYMEAHNNLATRLMATQRFEEGLAELRIAERLDPAAGPVHSNLAFAHLKMGNFKEAEKEVKLAIALDPTAPNPRKIALQLQGLRQNKTVSGTKGKLTLRCNSDSV